MKALTSNGSFPFRLRFIFIYFYALKRGDTFSQIGRRRNFNIFSRWYLIHYCTWRDFCPDYFIKMSFTLWNASVWQSWTPCFVEQALTQWKYQEYTCDWPLNKPCLLLEFGSLCAWAALKGVFFFPIINYHTSNTWFLNFQIMLHSVCFRISD